MSDEMKRNLKVYSFMAVVVVIALSLGSGLVALFLGWLTSSMFVGKVTFLVLLVGLPVLFCIGLLTEKRVGQWWHDHKEDTVVVVAVELGGFIIAMMVVIEFAIIFYALK